MHRHTDGHDYSIVFTSWLLTAIILNNRLGGQIIMLFNTSVNSDISLIQRTGVSFAKAVVMFIKTN